MKFTAIVFLRLSSQKNKQTKKRKNFICESSFEAAVFITANKVKDSLVIFFPMSYCHWWQPCNSQCEYIATRCQE